MSLDPKIYTIDPSEIIVPEDRIRRNFEAGPLRDLAMSIKSRKQDTPGICKLTPEGRPELIAGERRLRACSMAGVHYRYILVDELDEITRKEIELEENLLREDLSWQEETTAKLELHKLKQEIHGESTPGSSKGWSERDTAKHLKESVGKTHGDLQLAQFAEHFEEVREAKTKNDAKKAIKAIQEKQARVIALKEAEQENPETSKSKEKTEEQLFKDQILHYGKKIHKGRMEEVLAGIPDEEFDVIFFDPPWGVSFDSVSQRTTGQDIYKDDPETFFDDLEDWLKLLYKKAKPNAHLYMFFGIVHHDYIYNALLDAGWETNRMPLIWHKSGAHRTRNPDKWPGRSYEPIAFAHKGSKKLVRKGAPDIIITPSAPPSLKKNHPSAKHPSIYLNLLQRSCRPGDKILDPMCGSGMLMVASESLSLTHKLDCTLIEENKDFHALAISNVVIGYATLLATNLGQASEEEGSEEEFTSLEPGSAEWKEYWSGASTKTRDRMFKWSTGVE